MKKTLSLILLLALIFLTSCSKERSAEDIALAFCEAYPLEAQVYSSLSSEYDDGYIDEEMLTAMYGEVEIPAEEFALILYGKVSTVREIGVFIAKTSDERMELYELATNRIEFLSTFVEGEGFIKKYRGVFVYGFVDDALGAERIFDGITQCSVRKEKKWENSNGFYHCACAYAYASVRYVPSSRRAA